MILSMCLMDIIWYSSKDAQKYLSQRSHSALVLERIFPIYSNGWLPGVRLTEAFSTTCAVHRIVKLSGGQYVLLMNTVQCTWEWHV